MFWFPFAERLASWFKDDVMSRLLWSPWDKSILPPYASPPGSDDSEYILDTPDSLLWKRVMSNKDVLNPRVDVDVNTEYKVYVSVSRTMILLCLGG